MTKKTFLIIAVFVVIAIVYAIWFTDWFKPKTIQIFHTFRGSRARVQRIGTVPSLIFAFNHRLKITELEVVPLDEFQTNHNAFPIWHLVSTSNSVPVDTFFYGQNIRGLHPAIKGTHPQSPETNVTYRLFINAGGLKGQHDFKIK